MQSEFPGVLTLSMYNMKPVYIIDTVRTAIGRYGGGLSSIRPDDLLAEVIKALLKRNGSVDMHAIEDVIAGDANQAGEDNRNVARMAALLAGLPVTVGGNTVKQAVCKRFAGHNGCIQGDHVW
jgi:Acetyl-CoA acetyltransferase